jgi:hypothetical protein
MNITRTSIHTGIKRTIDLNVTEEQYKLWETGGALIQNAMPQLSADDREFILTGCTPEEWDDLHDERDGI